MANIIGRELQQGLCRINTVYRGAFVASDEAVLAIEEMLVKFIWPGPAQPEHRVEVVVQSEGEGQRNVDGASAVAELRNPRGNPIRMITLTASRPDSRLQVQLDSTGSDDLAGVRLFGEDNSADRLSSFAGEFDREVRNIRDVPNSLHRWPIDAGIAWLKRNGARIGYGMVAAWAILMLIAGAGAIIDSVSRSSPPTAHVQPRATAPPPEVSPKPPAPVVAPPLPTIPPEPIWPKIKSLLRIGLNVLAVAAVVALVIVVILGYSRLFPRVVFTVGEGKARHESLRRVRWFIVGTVVVSGLLIPWGRTQLQTLLDRAITGERGQTAP